MRESEKRSNILDQLYQVSRMGMEAAEIVLPKIQDRELRTQVEKQNETYLRAMRQSRAMLQEAKRIPGEVRPSAKRALHSVFHMGAKIRRGSEHFAGLMISGASAGVDTLSRALNNSPDEDPETRWLVERYIQSEERNIDALKRFL